MNKSEFVAYIAEKNDCSKVEAEKAVNMFTTGMAGALSEGNDVSLVGFGGFSVAKVAARKGRNPRTGDEIKIAAYNQPKFKVGKGLKDAVNGSK